MTPSDGIGQFLEEGMLPPWPTPLLPLEKLYRFDPDRGSSRMYSKPYSRELLYRLQEGDASLGDPHDRMVLAGRAGVVAGATLEEITYSLSSEEVPHTTDESLDGWLARARRQPLNDVVVWIGDRAHLINPSPKWPRAVLEHPSVECHVIQRRPSAAQLIGNALESRTYDQHIDAPLLSGILEGSETDPSSQVYARLCWLQRDFNVATAQRPADVQASLAALLAATPPPAALLVRPQFDWFVAPRDLMNWAQISALVAPRISGRHPILCQRDQSLVVVKRNTELHALADPTNELVWNRALDAWDETRHRIRAEKQAHARTIRLYSGYGGLDEEDGTDSFELAPFEISKLVWQRADLNAALVLEALRRATHTAALLPGGDVRLSVAAGIVARISIRVHASDLVGCALLQPLEADARTCKVGPNMTYVPLVSGVAAGYDAELGPSVPEGVYLMAKGLRADVTFYADPFSASINTLHTSAASLLASAVQRKRVQQSQRDTYDDDDDD